MDKNIEVCLLLDFYGQLLTSRQEETMNMYYNNDLSLGEIAENLNITRQGVHDNIKRSEKTLLDLENKLGIIKRFRDDRIKIKYAVEYIDIIDMALKEKRNESAIKDLKKIKKILNDIIDD